MGRQPIFRPFFSETCTAIFGVDPDPPLNLSFIRTNIDVSSRQKRTKFLHRWLLWEVSRVQTCPGPADRETGVEWLEEVWYPD